jgi:hypothetical protein
LIHHKLHGWPAILCGLLLFCGCTQAAGPVTYKEIVLDTYDSLTPGDLAPTATYMELWSSDGKTLLASDDAGGSKPVPLGGFGFAYIDYTNGLVSGDYYVLVMKSPSAPANSIGYAIRVMTASSASYVGWGVGGAYATELTTDAPAAGGTGIPTTFKTIVFSNSTSDKLNREILNGGVNWIKLTLP